MVGRRVKLDVLNLHDKGNNKITELRYQYMINYLEIQCSTLTSNILFHVNMYMEFYDK
jgi:hypothetical protein